MRNHLGKRWAEHHGIDVEAEIDRLREDAGQDSLMTLTRKGFFATLAGCGVAVARDIRDADFGAVNYVDAKIPSHVGRYRVIVDGEDVTHRCYRAHAVRGKAWCCKHNRDGQLFSDSSGCLAKETLTGKVEIVPIHAFRPT